MLYVLQRRTIKKMNNQQLKYKTLVNTDKKVLEDEFKEFSMNRIIFDINLKISERENNPPEFILSINYKDKILAEIDNPLTMKIFIELDSFNLDNLCDAFIGDKIVVATINDSFLHNNKTCFVRLILYKISKNKRLV